MTVSLGVTVGSGSFLRCCYGKWQFLEVLLWKVAVSLGVAMESEFLYGLLWKEADS